MNTSLFFALLLILTYSLSVFGQNPKDKRQDSIKRAMELREQLHRRLMDHLFKGTPGSQDEIFKDMEALFQDVMKDMNSDFGGFGDLDSFTGGNKSYDMAWTESAEGRTLLLSPKDTKQPLEINVEKGMISIKGKQEEKTPHGTSVSSFSHSYSIPGDVDGSKVKMLEKDGKIMMSFPYRKGEQPQKMKLPERRPVDPGPGEVTI